MDANGYRLAPADHGMGETAAKGREVLRHLDLFADASRIKLPLHGGDRHDALVRVVQMETSLFGFHDAGFEEQDARDELQAVRDAASPCGSFFPGYQSKRSVPGMRTG